MDKLTSTRTAGVPSYLEVPPDSWVAPPVETLSPTLPCDQLTWPNFERLCVRLARLESEIEHSQLYGVPGQSQHGIDLYARAFDGRYSVFQCKRGEQFRAGDLATAVTEFSTGMWSDRARRFVVCTTDSGARTQLAEEFEKQTRILRDKKVNLDLWDRERVSLILRDHLRLVFDFFGKAWVEAFLGHDALVQIGKRLDPSRVIEFREKLRTFYAAAFSVQDPGIPIVPRPGLERISLMERFVPQDVFVDIVV